MSDTIEDEVDNMIARYGPSGDDDVWDEAGEMDMEDFLEAVEAAHEAMSPVKFPPRGAEPVRRVLQSADLDIRTCEHEIAAALAVISGEDPVIAEVPDAYVRAAQRVVELIGLFPKCPSKGTH